ncbi:MAG: ABC transporter ATP-binding protein [Bacillota bacterium]
MTALDESCKTILRVNNLSIQYDNINGPIKVIRNLNFSLSEKEVLGIVGESGSGKTTLVLSLMDMLPPGGQVVDGDIIYRDRSIFNLSKAEKRSYRGKSIAMIFQEPVSTLNPVRRIGSQFIETLCCHFSISKTEARERAIDMLSKMNLPNPDRVINYFPFQLSGGMKQRVTIAMAMALEPDILIADEPTSALDVTVQAQIIAEMQKLLDKFSTSIVLITHNMGVVAHMAHRIGVMYAGQMVELGDKHEIINKPRHPYTRALLSSVPVLNPPRNKKLFSIKGQPPEFLNLPTGCTFAPRCSLADRNCNTKPPQLVEVSAGHTVLCRKVESASKVYREVAVI